MPSSRPSSFPSASPNNMFTFQVLYQTRPEPAVLPAVRARIRAARLARFTFSIPEHLLQPNPECYLPHIKVVYKNRIPAQFEVGCPAEVQVVYHQEALAQHLHQSPVICPSSSPSSSPSSFTNSMPNIHPSSLPLLSSSGTPCYWRKWQHCRNCCASAPATPRMVNLPLPTQPTQQPAAQPSPQKVCPRAVSTSLSPRLPPQP